VVVGAGPNGLAAAVVLASAGLSVQLHEAASTVGGGARTAEVTLPGFLTDHCSAVHPAGLVSPFFRAFDLESSGVQWLQPEVPYAQPLDGGRAGLAFRDLDATADALGADGRAWRSLLGPLVRHWEDVVTLAQSDLRTFPGLRPQTVATGIAMGLRALEQGTRAWNARFDGDAAPAMLTGVSTHSIAPSRALMPAGAGLYLAALAHAGGWPLVRGGSQQISDALAAELVRLGGTIVTDHRVGSLSELPRSRAVLLDITPKQLLEMAGDALPPVYRHWMRAFRYGGAACKVDYALAGPVPWTAEGLDRAGTLHLGGSRAEMLATEREVAAGRHPEQPYVIAVQPEVVDDTRAPAGRATLWTYAHVPNGSTVDMGDAVDAQIERFAPGFRDLVLDRKVLPAARQEEYDENYVGGDIASGAVTPWQMVARPAPKWDPYRTPLDGVYLCGASTPAGPAVTGMNGTHAAARVLRQRFGVRTDPLELVRAARAGAGVSAPR